MFDRYEIFRIAGEARVDPLTVKAVLRGGGYQASRVVVLAAIQRLGLEPPPKLMAVASTTRVVA